MKKGKRPIALILSFIMIFTLTVSAYANIASDSNVKNVIEAGGPGTSQIASSSNAALASTSNATLASNNNAMLASYSNMVRTERDEKLQGVLQKGTAVYKEPSISSNSFELPLPLSVTIKNHYYNNEETDEEWYEISYDNWIINIISQILDYHFVLVSDVEIELSEIDIPDCDCGYIGDSDLTAHADACAKKSYVRDIYIIEKTAEEIYADWDSLDDETRSAILEFMSWNSSLADKLDELEKLIEDGEQLGSAEVELPDGTVITATGIPDSAKLLVDEVSDEKREISVIIARAETGLNPYFVNGDECIQKAYNINIEKNGIEWQPSDGKVVDIEMDLEVDWLNYRTEIQIIHVLDTVESINRAEYKYLYWDEDLKELFPEACEAAVNAGYTENTILYTIMTPESGEVSYDTSGKLTIHATSFSDYFITAYNVDTSEYLSEVEESGLRLDKNVVYDSEKNKGTLILESYVKGTVASTPTDVVLVIDHSGSMWTAVDPDDGKLEFSELDSEKGTREGYYVAFSQNTANTAYLVRYKAGNWQRSEAFNTGGVTTYENGKFVGFINTTQGSKRDWTNITDFEKEDLMFYVSISGALYDALNIFMDEMKNAVDCRVAVVTFAGSTSKIDADELTRSEDYKGSGIFVDGELEWDKTQPALDNDIYKKSFEDPTTKAGQDILSKTIEAINTDYGSTPTALGLLYARRLFIKAGRTNSNKVAIVFTDGLPSPEYLKTRDSESCEHTGYDSDCPYCVKVTANDESFRRSTYIDQAHQLKNRQKAEVYSIGPTSGKAGVDVLKAIATDDNHVYNAGAGDLSEVFRDIAGVIVASSQQLNKDSIVQDDITQYFMLPNGMQKEDIHVYTADYNGLNANGEDSFGERELLSDPKIQIDGRRVQVSNFKYDENAVYMAGDTAYGKKLIIEIPIVPNPDFLGGDQIKTNEESSAIYNGDVVIGEFPKPEVDVKVSEIKPAFTSHDIYVSQEANIPQILNMGEFTQNSKDWKIDGINNAYVDIVYTVTDEDGKKMTCTIEAGTDYSSLDDLEWTSEGGTVNTCPRLTQDTMYTIMCQVISTNNKENASDPKEYSEKINVYKPELTFKDSEIKLGEIADYANNVGTEVAWKHGTDTADPSVMGDAPTMVYTYAPVAEAFTKDTNVNVTVTAKQDSDIHVPSYQDITQHVTFYRDACTFVTCDHKTNAVAGENDANFVVHVGTFNLTITKSGANEILDPNQTFIFRVTGPNDFFMDVVIKGNGSVTIESLPVASENYKVTELENWSWRYEADESEKMADYSKMENGNVSVAFTNGREEKTWLDGNTWCENIFVNGEVDDKHAVEESEQDTESQPLE